MQWASSLYAGILPVFNAETLATVIPKWCCVAFPFAKHCSKKPKVLKEEVVEIQAPVYRKRDGAM